MEPSRIGNEHKNLEVLQVDGITGQPTRVVLEKKPVDHFWLLADPPATWQETPEGFVTELSLWRGDHFMRATFEDGSVLHICVTVDDAILPLCSRCGTKPVSRQKIIRYHNLCCACYKEYRAK